MSGSKSSSHGGSAVEAAPSAATLDEPLTLTVHSLPTASTALAREPAKTRAGRWKMLLLFLVCASPVIASYLTYYVIRPEGRRNYGELIDPQRPMPALSGVNAQGQTVPLDQLRNQWLFISVADSACDAQCLSHLYLQRQLREGLGREKDRLDWVWLRTGSLELTAAAAPGHRNRRGAAHGRGRHCAVAAACAGGAPERPPVRGGPPGQLDDAFPRECGAATRAARSGPLAARVQFLGPGGALTMDDVALYDYSPTLTLMALGILIALGPLAWVWLRNRQASSAQRLAWLTAVTLFLTFDLVLFGAFTRLTDSGLGCPDWPGCYGSASPLGARADIAAAQAAMPTGPVTFPKAWIEMIHRYLATGVGVLILVLAVASWRERHRVQAPLFWPFFTLFWVCLQGAFGALTVTMKLFPAIVTLHLLGGMALLALLRLQAVRYQQTLQGAASFGVGGALRQHPRLRAGPVAGVWSGVDADCPGRLGQHQLRGAGVSRFPDLPGQLVASHGFLHRVSVVA
jgi:hypothetical protein